MIKSAFILLATCALLFVNAEAQSIDADAVDIRALLDKQISEIKNKRQGKKEILKEGNKQAASVVPINGKPVSESIKEFLSKDTAVKVFVAIEILMISILFFLWSTKARREKRRKIIALKNNIKKLREERIGSLEGNSLSMLRGNLRYDPIKINDNGKDITYRARKNNIGKGEIHLAAKIKLLTGEYK